MYRLETNVTSELRKAGDKTGNGNVILWLSSVDAATFYLPAITAMDIEPGILQIERRDPAQGGRRRAWMKNHALPEFVDRTVSVGTTFALRCAALHFPDPDSEHEAFIAATVLVHSMTIVPRNVTSSKAAAVPLLNLWSATQ